MRKYSLLFLLLMTTVLYAQKIKEGEGVYYYNTELGLGLSTKDKLPFWMQSNKFGLVPDENYGSWGIELKKQFEAEKKFDWSFGVMGAASVADKADVCFRDYYLGLRYGRVKFYAGAKADEILYDGLSSTNGNFIWSSNARPYPKLAIELPYTDVPFTKGWVQFKGGFSEGMMIDDRFVDKPHVHHKNLYLKTEKGRFAFEVGINHYAQWGGESPRFGKLASNFKAYTDMFFTKNNSKYDELGNEIDHNRVGNHLGMLDVKLHYKRELFTIDLYRQVIFEDASGKNFFNRDALHGIYLTRTVEKAWFQSFLLEYYYTKKQSGEKVGKKPGENKLYTGQDNYFNHSTYRSGWTSYGHTIGTPFFTPLRSDKYAALGIANNRIEAIHGGIFGYVARKYPYKVLLSYSNNIGTYSKPMDKNQVSGYFEMTLPIAVANSSINVSWGIAGDKGGYLTDSWGTFLKISTNGWWRK